MKRAFATFVLFCCLVLSAHAQSPYKSCLIEKVPHVKQKSDFCGEACAEMYLRKLGSKITQDEVFNRSGLDPSRARGCYTADLERALKSIGFKPGNVFSNVAAAKADAELETQWKALHADLLKGVPSIVCMHYDDQPKTTEHFRLILGYDADKDEVIYHEPAQDNGAYLRMKKAQFLKLWPLKYEADTWLVIRLLLEAGPLEQPAAAPAKVFTNADYAQHMIELKKKIPNKDFTVVIQPPFVVIGDGIPELVQNAAKRQVKWAVDLLKKDFFSKDPDEIIDIWLFKDDASYRKYTKEIFGDTPSTPFGYYSTRHRALIMNIATGGGTLIHEIVHPFVRANFPKCPSWFNEGLGSLFEQCQEKDGHIRGLTNWRLAGLQKAIGAGNIASFSELTGTTDVEFYDGARGTNYAQARYLCYYLQEKGLLVKFYRDFVANQKDDPTGYDTLKKILGEDDMDAFKKKWEQFVMKLTFP